MGISMFSAQASPIAIDLGASAVKLLQVGTGDKPAILAAAELPVPESIGQDQEKLFEFYVREIPRMVREGKFKGKRAVCAVPSGQTFVQHMQIPNLDGTDLDEAIKLQLQMQMGCSPRGIVVRSVEVGDVHRDGQARKEVICFAVAREAVMKYVDMITRCKLTPVGVHTETVAMVRSFDHLNRRTEDSGVTTLYVDLGWNGTRVAVSHGRAIRFARYIPLGGRNFDQVIASMLNCDLAQARKYRLNVPSNFSSMGSLASTTTDELPDGQAVFRIAMAKAASDAEAGERGTTIVDRRVGRVPEELRYALAPDEECQGLDVDLGELLETVTDELSMCLRYHRALFPKRPIDRMIFLGGEARQAWLCQHVIRVLRLQAQLGDPLARLKRDSSLETPGFSLDQPQPGWAVPCGLCIAPTDL